MKSVPPLQMDPDGLAAARVNYRGQLLAANPEGTQHFENLQDRLYQVLDLMKGEKPFQLYFNTGLMLVGTPLAGDEGFLLQWQPVTEAEVRLALFQAVARSVNSSLILEEIFDALGEVLGSFIPFEAGTIVILDDSQNTAKVVVSLLPQGQAEISGESNLFAGYDAMIDDLLRRPHSRLIASQNIRSVLVDNQTEQTLLVPLVSKGVMIGCIGLSGSNYQPTHLNLLEEVSEQLAVAVENARLYWQTQSQAGREFLINQITKSIRQSLQIEEILQTTVQEVGKVMGLSRCLIHYWGVEPDAFQYFEYVLPGINPVDNPDNAMLFERELFTRRSDSPHKYNPFILNDTRNFPDGRAYLHEAQVKSLAVFPILLQERNFVGTISLHQCDTFRAWLSEEIELLKAIAEHVAVALHQANLFQEKENQRKRLEDTIKELQQTQMQLIQSEKMAVLGQFVAGIAHEVNTPLGTLVSNDDTVQRCLEKIETDDPQAIKMKTTAIDLLKINRMASERIQEIVKNLRNFARLDESDLKQVNIHEGLDSTLLLIHSSLRGKIRIIKQYGNIPLIDCFPGLLNQVFMNLLINASHSIEQQGEITIETWLDEAQNQVHVAIKDTGKGISPEHLPRIFDPGFTTKGVGVGTGLGLALCYKIIEKHHGRIDVESTPGVGTAMTVILPIRQKPPQPDA